ncbi:MAG: siderophore-interacting protein [Propionibacteriaceae bacterium]
MIARLERLVIKAMGSKQTTLTVLENQSVTPHFQRIFVDCGTLFSEAEIHPTMWLRLWFDNQGGAHQRAFTLVDPDPTAGTAWLEFSLHEGIASNWARTVAPGQTIEASLLGSKYDWHQDSPSSESNWEKTLIVGDMAALPAINSLLDHIGNTPATVILEYVHSDDLQVPVRLGSNQHLIRCLRGSDECEKELFARVNEPNQRIWIALEAGITRSLVKKLRHEYGVSKSAMSALGYWKAS